MIGSATVAVITAAGIVGPLIASTGASPELMVLAVGAGSVFGSHVNDSAFWMFETGKVQADQRKRSWLKRIQFDWKDTSSLLLCVEDRSVLQALPGGRAMLRLWDSLWAS